MKDPMVQVFSIRRPWPKVRKLTRKLKTSFRGVFWRVAGYELYWPALVSVWHVEPGQRAAGTVCGPDTWRKHPQHWKVQVHPWQSFCRWAFTRCVWCGGPSRKGDSVNTGYGYERDSKKTRWWQGESGLYHSDCITVENAHRICVCLPSVGGPWRWGTRRGVPYGECGTCGKFRPERFGDDEENSVRAVTTDMMRMIPRGTRDESVMMRVRELWDEHRSSKGGLENV